MSLAGCHIIPIDLDFHLQKCLEIFDKNSADKIQSKNHKGVNPPCRQLGLIAKSLTDNTLCFPSKNSSVKKRCINFRIFLTPLCYRVRTFNFACMRRGDEIFSFLAKLTAFSQQLYGKLTISACLLIILLLVLDNCWNNLLLLYFPLLTRNAGEIFPSICMVKFRLCYYSFSGDQKEIELAFCTFSNLYYISILILPKF